MNDRLVDLSHAFADGQGAYPGLPQPVVGAHLSHETSRAHYAEGTCFHIGRVEMVTNTGTYLDAPFHRFPHGTDVAELALGDVADLAGRVIDVPPGRTEIGADLVPVDAAGSAVLFRTGWSTRWGTAEYAVGHPYLTEEAAARLVDVRVALVGIDSLNIDATGGGTRPVHTRLLAAGIPIVEHLTALDQLPASGFRFFAVPVKVRGLGSFPVRAFAILTEAPDR